MTNTEFRIEMLGGLRVHHEGQTVEKFQTHKTGALLAFLALRTGLTHAREAVAETIWETGTADAIRNRLNQAVSSLRRQLHPAGRKDGLIKAEHHTLVLNRELFTTDVEEFEAEIAKADRAADRNSRLAHLHRAAELYKGPLLSGFTDDWVTTERLRLECAFESVLTDLVHTYSKSGEPERALEFAQKKLRLDPLDEAIHLEVMDLLIRAGRASTALRQFEDLFRLYSEQGELLSERAFALRERAEREVRRGTSLATKRRRTRILPDAAPDAAERREAQRPAPAPKLPTLPKALTPLLGRQEELAAVHELFESGANLVTLVGIGGTGKTRLALEYAWQVAPNLEGAAYLVPLTGLPASESILHLTARSILSDAYSKEPTLQTVAHALELHPRSLVIFDNAENVADELIPLVMDLLEKVEGLEVLVTSRQPLGLTTEQTLLVSSLELPKPGTEKDPETLAQNPSVALFVARAKSVKPDFALNERNAESIASLVAQLEGLPLALELAAGWARVLSPGQMIERLKDRFDLLETRRKDISPRHRSMRAAVDSSFELLPADLRKKFFRLCVFPETWDRRAAEAILGKEGLDPRLDILAERGLILNLNSEQSYRFYILDLLRTYGRSQLSRDEAQECGFLHAQHFLQRCSEQPASYSNYSDYLTALNWFIQNSHGTSAAKMVQLLSGVWEQHGKTEEAREWTRAVLDLGDDELDTSLRLLLESLMARYAFIHAEYDLCRSISEEVRRAIDALEPSRVLFDIRTNLTLIEHHEGNYEEIDRLSRINIDQAIAIGDFYSVSRSYIALGNAEMRRADYAAATGFFLESYEYAKKSKDHYRISTALHSLGEAASKQQKFESASYWFEQAIGLSREKDSPLDIAITCIGMSEVYLSMDQLEDARGSVLEVLAIMPHDWYTSYRSILYGAYLLVRLEDGAGAARLFGYLERARENGMKGSLVADTPTYNQHLTRLKELVSEQVLEQNWDIGKTMSLSQAIALLKPASNQAV